MEPDKENQFLRETIDPDYFKLENVIADNACFYRTVANGIMHNFDKNPDKKYSGVLETQTSLAKELQTLSYNWVIQNKNEIINWKFSDSTLDIQIDELIKIIHDIELEEYIELYKYFAGDLVYYSNNNILKVLPNRWGSYLEQVAISKRLQIPIIVFVLQKYNKSNNKIISGRIYNDHKIYKNTRLKIWQISGKEFMNINSPIYLLWKKNKKDEHYMSLYPINNEIDKELIKNII